MLTLPWQILFKSSSNCILRESPVKPATLQIKNSRILGFSGDCIYDMLNIKVSERSLIFLLPLLLFVYIRLYLYDEMLIQLKLLLRFE